MVTTKLNLSMTEPQVRQIYAKQGDTGRVLDITLDQTPEDGTLRILRPDGVEVTSEAVTGGEVESGETFESLAEADVTELTVGIEPVQDLNGYDAPWVGGAGNNLYDGSLIYFNSDSSATSLNGITLTKNADGSFRVRGTASAETRLNVNYTDSFAVASYAISVRGITGSGLRIIVQGRPSSAGIAYTSVYPTSDWSQVYSVTESSTFNYFYLDVQNGATIDFTLKVQIEKGSTATAWSPYSNICPITGHDEVTVTETGKNRALFANESNQDRASFTYESETANKIVATSTSTGKFVGRYEAFLVKGVSYKLLYTNKGASTAPYIYRDRLWGSLVRTVFPGEVFTVDTTQTYVIGIYAPARSTYDVEDFMAIEASETDTTWTPYQSNTYTTSLGQTVYGGTLDMASGVLTVTDANIASYNGETLPSTWISDRDVYSSGTTPTTGAQVVYKLATPTVIDLTPQQIKTLVGTNNVWASSGDIVNITFTYGGLLSELPSEATSVVGKCYCDVEQNGVSSMPFTLNVKKNERES